MMCAGPSDCGGKWCGECLSIGDEVAHPDPKEKKPYIWTKDDYNYYKGKSKYSPFVVLYNQYN